MKNTNQISQPGGLYEGVLSQLWRWRSAAVFVSVLISLFLIDKLCGLVVGVDYQVKRLALPPSEIVRYEARDFQFTVTTNRLGFRGPEFPLQRTPGVGRLLVLGNSFTFGWGVDFESTWPHLLERNLTALGMPVEVANLATPGTTAREMTEIASRSVPLLKPDLVIISVLQGGSLFTLSRVADASADRERPRNAKSDLLNGFNYILPNYVRLLENIRHDLVGLKFKSASEVRKEWRQEAERFTRHMTSEQRQRYQALQPESVDRFVKGDLNVPVIVASIQNPDVFTETVRSSEVIDGGVAGMRDMFSQIKVLSEANGARPIVVSMPYGAYLGGRPAENLRRLGFSIPEFLENDRSTEDRIQLAARAAGVEFVSVLDRFQSISPDGLFIPFDGHYTEIGTRLYADSLSKEFIRSGVLLSKVRPPTSAP